MARSGGNRFGNPFGPLALADRHRFRQVVRSRTIAQEPGSETGAPTHLKQEADMKLHVAATGFILLAGVSLASAQAVIIEPEQEVVIREYVQKQPLASIDLPGVELNIGSTVPE